MAIIVTAFTFAVFKIYDGPWLFIFGIVVFDVLFFWFESWPCPRCEKHFTEPKRDLTYSKRCRNCGLELWKDPGDIIAYRKKRQRLEERLKGSTDKRT